MRLLPWTMLLAATQAYELCIGQDYWSIMNYTAVMGKPACVMSYASLYNLTAALWNGTIRLRHRTFLQTPQKRCPTPTCSSGCGWWAV